MDERERESERERTGEKENDERSKGFFSQRSSEILAGSATLHNKTQHTEGAFIMGLYWLLYDLRYIL